MVKHVSIGRLHCRTLFSQQFSPTFSILTPNGEHGEAYCILYKIQTKLTKTGVTVFRPKVTDWLENVASVKEFSLL